MYAKHSRPIAKLVMCNDFLLHRVMPKLPVARFFYPYLTRGKYHAVSEAEILGRLTHAGFEVIGSMAVDGLFYYSVIKTSEIENLKFKKPSYGIIFKMERVGKSGKTFGVYKVRTMHPYSEFIQKYVVMLNGYNEAGKPNQDFRLTNWGRVIRALHLDEVPQLLNLLKGEMNIVGVRPLSKFGFSALPEDLQAERIKYKPGCIPPNVALGLSGFDGVIKAERIYLEAMKKNRFLTNFKYFWMALYNLSFGKHLTS
jgi:lipopolysaccharide/colanic/teichoic acid biosynthesis glycosyltransferase